MTVPDKLTESEKQSAIEAFEALGLCTQLAEAAAALGWKKPSSIQEQAIPLLIAGTCVIEVHARAVYCMGVAVSLKNKHGKQLPSCKSICACLLACPTPVCLLALQPQLHYSLCCHC